MKKITIYLQFIMTIVCLVLLVMYLALGSEYLVFLEFSLGADLILMGINNKYFYKREYFTILYLVFGVGLIIYTLLNILGVF